MRPTSRALGTAGVPEATTYLVEHYWPGITVAAFNSATQRVRATARSMARGGSPIRYRHSILVLADEAAFCVFDAASMELIEQLYARAGVRFDRIVVALEVCASTRRFR
jgi:hypothetical protein